MNTLKKEIIAERLNEKFIYTYERLKNNLNGNPRYNVVVINTITLKADSFNVTAYQCQLKDIVNRYLIEREGK